MHKNSPPHPENIELGHLKDKALSLFEQNHLNEAIACYQQAYQIAPNDIDVLNNLGSLLGMIGSIDKAASYFSKLIKIAPNNIEAITNLATSYQHLGQFEQAEKHYLKALAIEPSAIDTQYNIAICYSQMGKIHQSYDHLNTLFRSDPNNPSFQLLKAELEYKLGHLEKAYPLLKSLIEKVDSPGAALTLLGKTLIQLNQFDDAIFYFLKSLEQNPNIENYLDIGYFLQWNKLYPISIQVLERGISQHPNETELLFALAESKRLNDEPKQAIQLYTDIIQLDQHHLPAHNLRLYTQLSIGNWSQLTERSNILVQLFQETEADEVPSSTIEPFSVLALPISHEDYLRIAKAKAKQYKYSPFPQKKTTHAIPRIGYISPDFNRHSIGLLIPEIIKHHASDKFEIYAYYTNSFCDTFTEKIKRYVNHFKHLPNLDPQQIAHIIYEDDIDILIDLTGYTGKCNGDILKYQPAKLQAHYLGYSASLEAPFIQGFISDHLLIPDEIEKQFSEEIWYLPSSSFSISPLQDTHCSFTRAEYGLPEDGFVYCCLCAPYRIEPVVFAAWMAILSQSENTYLWLYAPNDILIENLKTQAKSFQISEERLIFTKSYILTEHWQHQLADVWLDTLSVSSGTASLLSLQVNLPMVTLMGQTPQSRTSAAIVSHHGISELACHHLDEYTHLALKLYQDKPYYNQVIKKLTQLKAKSPVFAPKVLCQHLEDLYSEKLSTLNS